jgi:hypothetical protein
MEHHLYSSVLLSGSPLIRPVGHLLPRFQGRRDMVESLKIGKSFPAARLTFQCEYHATVGNSPVVVAPVAQRCEEFFAVFSAAPSMCLLLWQGEKVADRPDEGFFDVSVVWKYFTALPVAGQATR